LFVFIPLEGGRKDPTGDRRFHFMKGGGASTKKKGGEATTGEFLEEFQKRETREFKEKMSNASWRRGACSLHVNTILAQKKDQQSLLTQIKKSFRLVHRSLH